MSIDKLITYFNNYIPLNRKEREDLSNHVIEKKIKRRQFVLQQNDVCRHYTFVALGLLKMYAVDNNGIDLYAFSLLNEELISFNIFW